jgi:ribosomal protein L37AE/L43A
MHSDCIRELGASRQASANSSRRRFMAKRRPGKYDHLLPKLKPLPPQDLAHQQRVEDVKKLLRLCTLCEGTGNIRDDVETWPCTRCEGTGRRKLNAQILGAAYVEYRALMAEAEQALSQNMLVIEALTQMLIKAQEHQDESFGAYGASENSLKLTNGDTIRLQPEIFPVASNKNDFREWCFNHGLKNRMELPAKPMTDLCKQRLLVGEKEPDGINIFVKTKVVYTPLKTEVASTDVATTEEVF